MEFKKIIKTATIVATSLSILVFSSIYTIGARPEKKVNQMEAIVGGQTHKKWHKIEFVFDGPSVSEGSNPNPFRNYRLDVTFTSPTGQTITRPGYFAADGNAENTSATSGSKWKCNFTPNEVGTWNYTVSMRTGNDVSISSNPLSGSPVSPNGITGTFDVVASDTNDKGFRTRGMLTYVGEHYEIYGETGRAFIKAGPGSPENFLAYVDFDQTSDQGGFSIFNTDHLSTETEKLLKDGLDDLNLNDSLSTLQILTQTGTISQNDYDKMTSNTLNLLNGLHTYIPHISDWRSGDPVWKGSKGKGIIGALNYIAGRGCNTLYFMVHNRSRSGQGDGQDTWPWTDKNERERFDVSKLEQWQLVFDHASDLGIRLNMFLQEIEIQNDMGGLDTQRKLFFREMVARFGHVGGIQWNLGEENTQSHSIKKSQADFIRSIDEYKHPIAYHTNFNDEDDYYGVYGHPSFESSSFQGDGGRYDSVATEIRNESSSRGRKWIAYGDEQSPDDLDNESEMTRIFGRNVFSGGGGCEYYAGNPETGGGSDLTLENFRDYDNLWFRLGKMRTFIEDHIDVRTTIPNSSQRKLSNANEVMIYLQNGGSTSASVTAGEYTITWLNVDSGQISGGGTPIFLSGSTNLNSPFGGSQAIVAVEAIMDNDDASILEHSIPYRVMSGNNTTISVTVKNTGDTDWSLADGYRLSATNNNCTIFPSYLNILDGAVIRPNETYDFIYNIDVELPHSWCAVEFQMSKDGEGVFGNTLEAGFNVGQVAETDFTQGDFDWVPLNPVGQGSASANSNGLCMYVPDEGNNIRGWISRERYLELQPDVVYWVRLDLTTDQTALNEIPLLSFFYDNYNSNGFGLIYGGETFILDVGPAGIGGANGIGRQNGRDHFDLFFVPIASLTPQWNGLTDDSVGMFDPSVDAINDMRFGIRLLDAGSAGINANIDDGTVCLNRITITTYPLSDYISNTEVLFNDPITSASYQAKALWQNPLYANIDDNNNLVEYMLDDVSDTVNFFPGAEPFTTESLYPVEWLENTLYIAKIDMQLAESSTGNDPIDYMTINFDVATSELGQRHFITRGSPNNMHRFATPRKASYAGGPQTYISMFYGQNVTNIEGSERLRAWVNFANTPALFLTGTGSDLTQITNFSIEKYIPPQ